ncbi:MAG: hypothetical protein ACI89Z_000866 [Porticoccus sp.]|jgi:hypothetical protein
MSLDLKEEDFFKVFTFCNLLMYRFIDGVSGTNTARRRHQKIAPLEGLASRMEADNEMLVY